MTGEPLYAHVAACVDGSDAAARALDHAVAVRAATGVRLSVVHVIPSPGFLVSMAASVGGAPMADPEIERTAAEGWLAELVRGIDGASGVLLEGHPPTEVVAWAEQNGCDLLVAATHRGLVERALLGSFSGHLAHHSRSPVLLIPPAERAGSD
jgi:nucleotide-binding universal stress UspA family protein